MTSQSPFLDARRRWNSYVAPLIVNARMWAIFCLLSFILALSSIIGMIYFASRSSLIPYIVEIDRFGAAAGRGPLKEPPQITTNIQKAALSAFIRNWRIVTPDAAIQKHAIYSVYSFLSSRDSASNKIDSWYRQYSPLVRAKTQRVDVIVNSLLQDASGQWIIDWTESIRGITPGKATTTIPMRAYLTLKPRPGAITDLKVLLINPLSLFVVDASWSKKL